MYFVLMSSRNDVTPALKAFSPQYFFADGTRKIANFERQKVHEDKFFEL
jgi:hypothetical protein